MTRQDPITAEHRIQADCRARLAVIREKPWTAGSQDLTDIRIRFRESLARERAEIAARQRRVAPVAMAAAMAAE